MTDEESNWKVKEATEEELDGIRENLEKSLPESAVIYGALLGKRAYEGIFDMFGTKVYFSDVSSFVALSNVNLLQDSQSLTLFWERKTMNEKTLIQLLSSIPDFDWEKDLFIYAPHILMEKVDSLISSGAMGSGRITLSDITHISYYSMPSVPDIPIRLPDGYEIRRLEEKHADHMYDNWPHNATATKELYRRLVAKSPGFGVFRNKSGKYASSSETKPNESAASLQEDPGDNPVAWTQLHQLNLLSNTFTLEGHRRKGLASAVTLALAMQTFRDTRIAAAPIVEGNKPSEIMHQKLGFSRLTRFTVHAYKSCGI